MANPSSEPPPFEWIQEAIADLDKAGLLRKLSVRSSSQGPSVVIDGKTCVNFGSNDYLGLAGDCRLVDAANAAAKRYGWGGGASPLVSGRAAPHAELEQAIADFEKTEAALLFPTGYAANAGVIPSLVGEGDAIFSDARNHASIIDGCRLSGAKRFIYSHRDTRSLEAKLEKASNFRRRLIVTDSLFSMQGTLAPLLPIAELAIRYGAMLLVDEAHATGVFGPSGGGLMEHFTHENAAAKVLLQKVALLRMGTLSKAIGSAGGFVCGSAKLIDWLANRVRPYVFSTAQPPAVAGASCAALRIIKEETSRREALLTKARWLRSELQSQGWDTLGSQSQIIPLRVGDATQTMQRAGQLKEQGIFVPGIRPPTVPEGESLLRISLCWHHTQAEIETLLSILKTV